MRILFERLRLWVLISMESVIEQYCEVNISDYYKGKDC